MPTYRSIGFCLLAMVMLVHTHMAVAVVQLDDAASEHHAIQGARLSAKQAETLGAQLEEDPDNLILRTKLLGYYSSLRFGSAAAKQSFQRHALWVIEHRPESRIAGTPFVQINRYLDEAAYESAKKLWLDHIQANQENLKILGNASNFFTLPDRAKAIELLQRAMIIEPDSPEWPSRIGLLHALDALTRGKVNLVKARQAFEAYEEALSKNSDDRKRYYMLENVAKAALIAQQYEKAKAYATELLDSAADGERDWNYGNAVHHGNLVLGHVALIGGDVPAAERYLIRAGKTPGSPQLNSFGPNMLLAQALLESGRTDSVVEYLKLCGKFWRRDPLNVWIKDIEGGRMPKFRANLRY